MRDVFGAMHVGLVEGDERPVSGRSSPAIRVPPTAAAAVDAYLAGQETDSTSPCSWVWNETS